MNPLQLYTRRTPRTPHLSASEKRRWHIAPTSLEHLGTVLTEVFQPLLQADENHEHWPEVVTQDVMQILHKLSCSVQVMLGQTHVC